MAAKDASVIITVKKIDSGDTNARIFGTIQYDVSKTQCHDYAGIITNMQTNSKYAYTIGLIDIDRKPVDKVLL